MTAGDGELKREMGTLKVFSISTGAMISSGLFVLPAVVYLRAGPSIVLAYLLAAVLVIPAMFSKAELATAMPKSGGEFFFIQRSLGPVVGTFSGFASWFSLSLKSAFALVGIGVVLQPLVPALGTSVVKLIAVGFTNSIGEEESCFYVHVCRISTTKYKKKKQKVSFAIN